MEMLKAATGANLVHIPYRGSAPAIVDLVGGQIPLAAVDITSAYPHIVGGRAIALGMAEASASKAAPGNPDDRRMRRAGLRPRGRLHRVVRSARYAGGCREADFRRGPRDPGDARGRRPMKTLTVSPAYEDERPSRHFSPLKPRDGNRPCNRLNCRNKHQTQRPNPRLPIPISGRTRPWSGHVRQAKVLIFAPREEPPETIKAIEGLGCEIVIGNRDWQLPRTHYEDDVVSQARDCVALMGTSMRHTPISRRVMEASQRLRDRREIHRRGRRHRHRGRHRPRHHGLPRADRVRTASASPRPPWR